VGEDGAPVLPVDFPADMSPVAVHETQVAGCDRESLHAFSANSVLMNPVVQSGDILVTDRKQSGPDSIRDDCLYLLTPGPGSDQCAPRYLQWATRPTSVLIYGADIYYPP
jgi:hypothetical protein